VTSTQPNPLFARPTPTPRSSSSSVAAWPGCPRIGSIRSCRAARGRTLLPLRAITLRPTGEECQG